MQNQKEIQDWINSLKIALLEHNSDRAFELSQNLPFNQQMLYEKQENLELLENLEIAKELIGQTIILLQDKQNETRKQLNQMRQARKFLM